MTVRKIIIWEKETGEYLKRACSGPRDFCWGGDMSRFVCIHGHFYQPPRENPWFEEVETEDSAYPYHDWNERITAECYAPNAASRILDSDKRIIDIVNNYARISFNFGPTLLTWLERNQPEVYSAILEADKESIQRFSGHGSAIAQVYNHIIMPLATRRDKRTQVVWGIQDFTFRFRRRPEGMWLPETAVDTETLEILAEEGIVFTILSPDQACRVKPIHETPWTDVTPGGIDCSRPYLCRLPSGRSIVIFFYEETIAREVAFSRLLENGEGFARRLMHYFSRCGKESGLLSIASDGETYGHHHRFGDMALAYALHFIESKNLARITIYGEYLGTHPPTHEVEIIENTSWSCPHGIERWRSDCGCCTTGSLIQGTPPHPRAPSRVPDIPAGDRSCEIISRQQWRGPLREAMDRLSRNLAALYGERMSSYLSDPWKARDEYIGIILDRSPGNIEQFFSDHAVRPLSKDDKVQVLKLLEMQRNGMLMYTSCGWFFEDIAGIESVQVMRYACRAMQLMREVAGVDPEPEFIRILEKAPGNVPEQGNGARVYENFVRTAVADLSRVGFQYAVSSLVSGSPEKTRIRNYTLRSEAYERTESGGLGLALGNVFLQSDTTGEEKTLMFAVLHLENHTFRGGVREYTDEKTYGCMRDAFMDVFSGSNIPGLALCLEKYYGGHSYTLRNLTRDGQRKVLSAILDATLADTEPAFRDICRQFFPLLFTMREMQIPPPEVLEDPVRYIINLDLKKNLSAPDPDTEQLAVLAGELTRGKSRPDATLLNVTAGGAITTLMQQLLENPDNTILMEKINRVFTILSPLSLENKLWESQNYYFRIGKKKAAGMQDAAGSGDAGARHWIRLFEELGRNLGVKFL
jgi:alpha-amylase/alpha-mannosidase (GH57 family)